MRECWRVWVLVVAAAGCHHRPPVAPAPPPPQPPPVAPDLLLTKPDVPVLDARSLPKPPARTVKDAPEGATFRRLTETDTQRAAAAHAGAANLLEDENRVPRPAGECPSGSDQLRRTLRYHTALEFRNRAAADALERFFQLVDAEARTAVLRKTFPILDDLLEKAKAAKAADVRFPFDPADLERQRSQMVSQLEQAELGSRLLNLDMKRRIGLPYAPADERLWPEGDFGIDPDPADPEAAVAAALADRPELRGLRALYHGLAPDTLPDVRDFLGVSGGAVPPVAGLLVRVQQHQKRKQGPDPAVVAEVEVRRKQLGDVIATRERQVADETRAAALTLNAQRQRAALARERVAMWEEKLADAEKKRDAKQPGAEFLVPQVQVELLKAKAELATEVAAWHAARVRLKAAQGWLAWEAAGQPPRP